MKKECSEEECRCWIDYPEDDNCIYESINIYREYFLAEVLGSQLIMGLCDSPFSIEFVVNGKNKKQIIKNMPGVYRYSIDNIPLILDQALNYKIPMVAIFPR